MFVIVITFADDVVFSVCVPKLCDVKGLLVSLSVTAIVAADAVAPYPFKFISLLLLLLPL